MAKITLDWLQEILQGIMDGSIQITLVSQKRAKKSAKGKAGKAKKSATPAKRGRPKKVKLGRPAAAPKARRGRPPTKHLQAPVKVVLPDPKAIARFLADKYEGSTLTAIAKEFGLKRTALKPLVHKLIGKQFLVEQFGKLFLHHRPRRERGTVPPKPQPLTQDDVLSAIQAHPGATSTALAKLMGEPSYHRLIKPINALKRRNLIRLDGKAYYPA
jgi:hypothetical protein